MGNALINLMSFLLLPGSGSARDEDDFSIILENRLKSQTEEGKKYEIRQIISHINNLKSEYLLSLDNKSPYGDLLAKVDEFIQYSERLISDETNQNKDEKFTVPQKIKILDKLNIRALLNEKHGFTDFQTVQLLADLFGRTEKTVRNNLTNDTYSEMAKEYVDSIKELKAKR